MRKKNNGGKTKYGYVPDCVKTIVAVCGEKGCVPALWIYLVWQTRSGLTPVSFTNEYMSEVLGYSREAIRLALNKLVSLNAIVVTPASESKSRKREIKANYNTNYDPNGDAFSDIVSSVLERNAREQEAEEKKTKQVDVGALGTDDAATIEGVMSGTYTDPRFSSVVPKPPKNPTYQFDNPDELFEVFAREEWSATDALNVLRENSCLCKLPDERREEFIEVNSHERLAPYYHGKNKPTPEQEASAREAAEILYQTIQTEQQRRIDDESRNF